ncbi:MAG: alanine racemase [Methylococcaceae bacterium]|nr:alanine racemase [Methylococcaceae bacterium]
MQGIAYAEIDLAAVRHNLNIVRNHAPQANIMAVIKANAYGHGMVRIAKALENADAFAVARIDEAVRLRQAGIRQRIAVLQGFSTDEELQYLIDFNLEAVIHSNHQIEMLENRQDRTALTVWLKIDTGMNRLGFKPKETDKVIQQLKDISVVKQPFNLMTHLASADDQGSDFTTQQIDLFNQALIGVEGERSIGNSAGLMAWKSAINDWVRPGIMLYGISPFPDSTGSSFDLKPVMSFHSRLITVKSLEKGESVGYGNSWVCTKPILLGVVAIGYGDGYPRHAKPGTPVLINGQRVPLIGRVSMDMLTVDLSSLPQAKPGDKATLWGDGLPVEEIASFADTIPYTLVCGVTQRVHIIDHAGEAAV